MYYRLAVKLVLSFNRGTTSTTRGTIHSDITTSDAVDPDIDEINDKEDDENQYNDDDDDNNYKTVVVCTYFFFLVLLHPITDMNRLYRMYHT